MREGGGGGVMCGAWIGWVKLEMLMSLRYGYSSPIVLLFFLLLLLLPDQTLHCCPLHRLFEELIADDLVVEDVVWRTANVVVCVVTFEVADLTMTARRRSGLVLLKFSSPM